MPYVTLNPSVWPQDDLHVPRGQGGMPPVEFGNLAVVGSEFFALAADFSFPHTIVTLTTQTQILATPQDGDFWCDQITAACWQTAPGAGGRQLLDFQFDAMVTIRDIRTGKEAIFSPFFNQTVGGVTVTKNALPAAYFSRFSRSGIDGDINYDGRFPPPNGFRDTGTLIQPICFTRQGGIELTVSNNNAPPNGVRDFVLTLCFAGWKEYAFASH